MQAQKNYVINGKVFEPDSLEPMPFVIIVNQGSGSGIQSNVDGSFTIAASDNDTILVSFLGYYKQKIAVRNIKNTNDSTKQFLRVTLKKQTYSLPEVVFKDVSLRESEISYMERHLARPRATVESPFSFLYENFSKKGKENKKLDELYRQTIFEEEIGKKFNPEVLRKLTNDEQIDFAAFRKYAVLLTDSYIYSHNGYELYSFIMYYYKRYKADGK